jgi:hypothetical protein
MEAIDAYKVYVALKNHFTQSSYDYFKYNKKTSVTFDSFQKRRDKIFFARLGKRKDSYLEEFLVANFLRDPKVWIGELLSEDAENVYKEWKKKQESISYLFKTEIDFLSEYDTKEKLDEFFAVPKDGSHPRIFVMLLRKEISTETYLILDSILQFSRKYDRIYDDPLYKEVSNQCKKYLPFLNLDIQKQKNHLKSLLGM